MTDINALKNGIRLKRILDFYGIELDGSNMFEAIWRGEHVPSCKMLRDGIHFIDYGESLKPMDCINLVMKIDSLSFADALKKVYFIKNTDVSVFVKNNNTSSNYTTESDTKIIGVYALNTYQLEYSKSRYISDEVAKMHCRTVKYANKRGEWYAIGFPNDSGGFEIRQKNGFKACLGKKDISTIKRNDNKIANVFEGFFNYLSALEMWPHMRDENAIVLNSAALASRLLNGLSHDFTLNAYLDNDLTGLKCLAKLQAEFYVSNRANMYDGFNDLNQYLAFLKNRDQE